MSYKKTNWKTGDVITSQKLNHIENELFNVSLPEITLEDNKKFLVAKSEPVLDNPTELFSEITLNDGQTIIAIEDANINTFQQGFGVMLNLSGTNNGPYSIVDLSEEMLGAPIGKSNWN